MEENSRTGRRSLLTDERRKRISEALEGACFLEDAFQLAGVGVSTGYAWLERGRAERAHQEDGEPREVELPYLALVDDVERVQAEAKERLLNIISNDALDNASSAMWLLTKKFPKQFGENVRVHVEGELNAALDRLEAAFPAEQFEQIARVLAGVAGSPTAAPRVAELDGEATPGPR